MRLIETVCHDRYQALVHVKCRYGSRTGKNGQHDHPGSTDTQYRRAKLKRLNVEDRERMMRSRALPENFSMSMQASPQFGHPSSSTSPLTTSLGQNQGFGRGDAGRPLSLDTLRQGRPEHGYMSPTGPVSSIGSISFTPPQSATDTRSPISTADDMSAFGYGQRGVMGSPRHTALGSGSMSTPTYPTPYQQVGGRNPTVDRFRRPSGESASSPLRTNMTYGGFATPGGPGHESRDSNAPGQEQSQGHRGTSRAMPPPPGPYGLGFNCG